ncbi:hypothetical protein CHS0354_002822 [Potamilus streckersoni]|uniref:Uncharacterized protein n=1 Tax=Potamilus streckersoni TaxID=2493646 RepID=A0AAE0RMF0_9BIVA|nr:hypothetical protein CHS0354_002822 [Potamilus streckersoni]
MDHINRNVIVKLWHMSINGGDVDNTYIYQTMAEELDALKSLRICEQSTPRPCPYGFTCSKWISGKVLCSDRCDSHVCVHGTCYMDHQNEILPKCRCPIDDDGYVYSGDRCEHKSLSTLIIITSAVGGGVLIAAFFIICLICMKKRRNKEQLDNIPLLNLPNYSKYFHHDSTYQPQYGYDLPRWRTKSIQSRDWEVTPRYIPDRDDGQQENDTPSGDYVSDPKREKDTIT